MKIITKKQEQEIEILKKQNKFFSKGYRAMLMVLNYQNAIGAILETLNLTELEIDDKLLVTHCEIEIEKTPFNTTKIKLLKEE